MNAPVASADQTQWLNLISNAGCILCAFRVWHNSVTEKNKTNGIRRFDRILEWFARGRHGGSLEILPRINGLASFTQGSYPFTNARRRYRLDREDRCGNQETPIQRNCYHLQRIQLDFQLFSCHRRSYLCDGKEAEAILFSFAQIVTFASRSRLPLVNQGRIRDVMAKLPVWPFNFRRQRGGWEQVHLVLWPCCTGQSRKDWPVVPVS